MAEIIFDINTIVQGNNGNKLPITIKNAGSIEGSTVRIGIKRGAEVFTKQAVIIDATAGKCEVTLSAVDLPISGLYFFQPTITYADGREFTGEVGRFTVGGKLSGQPPVVIPAGIDLNRLGISANNRLTIDGVEQVGGAGGGTTEPLPSNVILFEDWVAGESVTIDTGTTQPPADTTAPVLTISPNGGNFASTQGVTMTTNETADIYYTLDGSTPTTASTKYTTALSLSATTTLKAFARDTAGNSSAVQTVTFTKDVTAPADTTAPVVTASPAAGTYTAAQSVTLTANETATIYYTTNGTTPTTASTVYTAPINISATTTLQFMAKDSAGNQSAPIAATYTINIPQADTTAPVLTMTAAATFADTQTVNMSVNETADIWYTVDGSDPVASGTRVKYTAPVTLTVTTTVKAYAVDTAGNASTVQAVVYTKQPPVSKQVVSSGLKAWYDMSEGSGTQATLSDKSGNGNNLTLTGFSYDGTTDGWVTGGALKGDGVDAIAKTANNLGIGVNGSRTIQFKFKVNSTSNKALVGHGKIDVLIYGGKIIPYNDTVGVSAEPFPMSLNEVIDVALVFNGTSATLYKNGVKAGNAFNISEIATGSLNILSGYDTSGFKYSANQVYYVTVYNRVLTDSEILENYNAYK